MKNSKLFTRFVTLVTIWSLVIGTGWMLPKDAMARQVRGHTRTNVNRGGNVNRNTNINRTQKRQSKHQCECQSKRQRKCQS